MKSALQVEFSIGGRHSRQMCLQDKGDGKLCQASASARVTILGWSHRCCRKHALEAREVWDRAWAGFPDESASAGRAAA